jgi:phosphate transport system substrate-binding protein
MAKKLLALVSLLLVLGLAAAACGSDDSENGSTTTTEGDAASVSGIDYRALEGSITGSGASFPDAFYQAAIDAFAEESSLSVTYNAVGSGQGKKDFGSDLNDFAGSDSLVKDGDGPAAGSFLYVPTVAAPITVSYHLSGIEDLQLGADTLAGIFGGTITSWDDPAIAADNPDADLPSKRIVVVHRADGSGTTSNFTRYLAKAAPNAWTLGSGDTVAWPADTQAGQKNTGVAQLIQDTDGAIGYVDLSDAEAVHLAFAKIQNRSGRYVAPTLEGAQAALAHAAVADDLSYDPLDAEGDDVYPITSPTYLLVRTSYADRATLDAVKGFVTFLLSEGQDVAEDVAFARLPDELREQALAQLDRLTVA